MKVNVYGLGGTGINNVVALRDVFAQHRVAGYADMSFYMVDSSDSNWPATGRPDREQSEYRLPKTDGAGGDRAYMQTVVDEYHHDILLRMPPADLNILVYSSGGGTGNVLAYYLTRAMMKAGHDVINLVAGCYDSGKDIRNSIKTIGSFVNLAKQTPLAMGWYDNEIDGVIDEKRTNARIQMDVMRLSALWSGQNHRIDGRDLSNWLRYDRITSYEAGLTELVIGQDFSSDKSEVIVSLASLYADDNFSAPVRQVEYVVNGIAIHSDDPNLVQLPVHFALKQGSLPLVLEQLQQRQDQYDKQRQAIRPRGFTGVAESDDGLVL